MAAGSRALTTTTSDLIDTILATFEESVIGEELSYIDISIPTMITMGVKNGLKIRIGDVDNMEQKLAWIDTLYPLSGGGGQAVWHPGRQQQIRCQLYSGLNLMERREVR